MLISKKHRKVVINSRHPERITTLIPTAKTFTYKGKELLAVPHKLDETKVLRNIGYSVPSPVSFYYSWSGRYEPFAHQRTTVEFLTLNTRAFVLNQIGCVDSETEYLSPTGWRKMNDYDGGMVAQYWPETGRAEFTQPKEYVKLPCDDMVRVKTTYGVDQLLSPEHRVLVKDCFNGSRFEVLSAEELLRRHNNQHIGGERAARNGRSIAFKSSAVPVTFSTTGGNGLALSDNQIRLQVAVIADGHFPNHTTWVVVRLKRERKIQRLHSLLLACDVDFNTRYEESTGFTVFTFNAPLRIKEFTPDWFTATGEQLSVVADEVMHWDGSFGVGKRGDRFSTTSKASADFVQYVFSATGRTARILEDDRPYKTGKCYSVQVRKDGAPLMLKSVSNGVSNATVWREKSTDGFKYCFMVPSTFLVFRRNGCVFASGNTGKSMSVLWAYDYLRHVGQARRMLIVSPLSTLERVWADELFKHFPHLTYTVLHGAAAKRKKLLNLDVDVYIINHDGVKVVQKELRERPDIDTVVIDELAEFRNSSTDRWKALNDVLSGRTWVWGLTGSPTPKAPTDSWAQVRLISPGRVPKYFSKFRDAVMRQINTFKWIPRPEAAHVVKEAMQPAILFKRDECIDLPPCTFSTRQVEMSPEQKKAYNDMMGKLKAEYAGGEITAVNEAVKALKLVQVAAGVAYDSSGENIILPAESRIKAVKEIVDEADGKVIVYVPLTGALNRIAEELREEGHEVGVVHGETNKTERDTVFSAFQSGDSMRVLVAHPKCMAHGLTLTAANVIVWYIPTNDFSVYEQACGRIVRPGQKRHQHIIHLEGSNVERKMYTRLENRGTAQGVLLDLIKEDMQS